MGGAKEEGRGVGGHQHWGIGDNRRGAQGKDSGYLFIFVIYVESTGTAGGVQVFVVVKIPIFYFILFYYMYLGILAF